MGRMNRIIVTGAAGRIGGAARRALAPERDLLRLLDRDRATELRENEEMRIADAADLDAMVAACTGMDCLVHLAGIPTEAAWDALLPANVIGAYTAFEAARIAGVGRVIFASSNHAMGYHPASKRLDRDTLPRPDSLYGAAKVWGEALASLYADRHGLETCALRIGSFRERPLSRRELRTWISHRDMGQLLRCCVDAPAFHHFVAYGLSANDEAPWENGELNRWLGYAPEDNAGDWRDDVPDTPPDVADAERFHGGFYCVPGFKGAPRLL